MIRTLMTAISAIALATTLACGDDNDKAQSDAAPDHDASPGGPDASCYENPTTHRELINACTSAQSYEKDPSLPLLNPDGTVPDLSECTE